MYSPKKGLCEKKRKLDFNLEINFYNRLKNFVKFALEIFLSRVSHWNKYLSHSSKSGGDSDDAILIRIIDAVVYHLVHARKTN